MISFGEMKYTRPDFDSLKACYTETAALISNSSNFEEAKAAFFHLQAAESAAETQFSLCQIRNTIDTTDAFYDAELSVLREQFAALIPLQKAFRAAMAKSPVRSSFEQEFGMQYFRLLDAAQRCSDEIIMKDVVREGDISQDYQRETACAQTEFSGKSCNFYDLLRFMESPDRDTRRDAFHAWSGLYERISPKLDAQYDELVKLRTEMAHKLGFGSYTEMAYLDRSRFDYTQEDAAAFRKQILETITPAVAEIRKRQKKHLGIDRLCYYDEALLFPDGNALPIGTPDELVEKARTMYREMSPETGEFFDFMVDYHLYDLETRPGKQMGGYMTSLPDYKAPFIFSNFNGTSADVDVLTHEAGHAFQGYLAMRSIPLRDLSASTAEIDEIHSMSMEHFAYPWMKSFFGESTEKYLTAHLISSLCVIPYMACVDEFQHRMYAEPDMSPMERRKVWRDIEQLYMPWRDYDGDSFLEEGGFWMQKLHIFLYPFYYIDYALAQVCAYQYYGLMKKDPKAAWQNYLKLCRAGGTKGYFDLLEIGSLKNPFKDGVVAESVGHVIDEINARY